MWRSISWPSSSSALLVERSSNFPRSLLLLSCLGNQTSITTSNKVFHKSIYSSSSSSSLWSQYQNKNWYNYNYHNSSSCNSCTAVIASTRLMQKTDWYLTDKIIEESLWGSNGVSWVDEERWKTAVSLLESCSHICNPGIESVLNCPHNWELLLNPVVFMRVPFQRTICDSDKLRYYKWALSRDDFAKGLDERGLFSAVVINLTADFDLPHSFPGWSYIWLLLWDLIKRLRLAADNNKDKACRTVESFAFHRLLGALASINGDSAAAVEMLDRFEEFHVPNLRLLFLIMCHLYHPEAELRLRLRDRDEPWETRLCQKFIDNIRPAGDVDLYSDVIWQYSAMYKPKLAHAVYIAHKDKGLPRRHALFYLIYSLANYRDRDDTLCLALQVLADAVSNCTARSTTSALFSCVITALCRKGDTEAAHNLMTEMILNGPPPCPRDFYHIIESLRVKADLEHAVEVLTLMVRTGLKPNVGTFLDLILDHKRLGLLHQAAKLLSMAKNIHPSFL